LSGEALTDGIIQAMIETYTLKLKQEGRPARIKAITQSMHDEAEALNAFALAAAAALADDRLDQEENELILELKDAFGLQGEQVAKILGQLKADRA
jgi:tellurite resistance protein